MTPPEDAPAAALLGRLSDEIDRVVGPLLPEGSRCALLGFPQHNNVGDNAIWLGEKALLDRLDVELTYVCDLSTYRRDRLLAAVPEGTILLHGGGNLGDVWPVHQAFRERVIEDFPSHRIIQLPQSIHFAGAVAMQRARAVFSSHRDLFVLARDHASAAAARELGARAAICPDMAFALRRLRAVGQPVVDVLWLARSDVEASSRMAPLAEQDVEVRDWLLPASDRRLARRLAGARVRFREAVNRQLERDGRVTAALTPVATRFFDQLARRRVSNGCELLRRGRVVITDRLHGHILSLLLGIPHVTLDNSYGKLTRFLETFSGGSPLTQAASDAEGALRLARQSLREPPTTTTGI
jgi:exopolysaccharide biosynthesis predicted pyruvyltransferase EpsI